MNHGMKGIDPAGVKPAPESPTRARPAGAAHPGFEAMLRRLSREVDALKKQARSIPDEIDRARPETLEQTLARADRNFETALTVGRTLLRAYQAVLPGPEDHRPTR